MADNLPNYYQTLGVPSDADTKTIQKEYRRLAKEYHPDALRNLPEDERKKRENQMKDLGEAYSVLSRPEKRSEYDKQRREAALSRNEGTRAGTREGTLVDFGNLFASFFQESGIFGPSQWETPREKINFLMFPENDLGLLTALKTAYKAEGDGAWLVKRSPKDKRNWLPEDLYHIRRWGKNVFISRRVVDWRSEWSSNSTIEVWKKGEPWKTTAVYRPDDFIDETLLCGEGDLSLSDISLTPHGFGEYLNAMKSLAKKMAAKEKDPQASILAERELQTINDSIGCFSRNLRVEGKSLFADDERREWARKIPLADIWSEIRLAEGLVTQVEGAPSGKEGQKRTIKPEGVVTGSGETKG